MIWTFRCPGCGSVLQKERPTDPYACTLCGWKES